MVSSVQCDCCRDSERVQIESPKIRISATSPSLFLEEKVLFANSCWRGGRDRQTSGDGDHDEDEYHGLVVVDSERKWK